MQQAWEESSPDIFRYPPTYRYIVISYKLWDTECHELWVYTTGDGGYVGVGVARQRNSVLFFTSKARHLLNRPLPTPCFLFSSRSLHNPHLFRRLVLPLTPVPPSISRFRPLAFPQSVALLLVPFPLLLHSCFAKPRLYTALYHSQRPPDQCTSCTHSQCTRAELCYENTRTGICTARVQV